MKNMRYKVQTTGRKLKRYAVIASVTLNVMAATAIIAGPWAYEQGRQLVAAQSLPVAHIQQLAFISGEVVGEQALKPPPERVAFAALPMPAHKPQVR